MRRIRIIAAAVFAAAAAAACTSTLHGRALADYCSDPHNAGKDLCAVNTEIQATNAKLAETDKTAHDALAMATEANGKNVQCQTVKLRRVKSASCAPGYTLMGCTQTHYTRRAGGMAIMRSISDEQCTFSARVLEVQARCCMVGAPQTAAAPEPAEPPPPPAAPKPTS